MKNTFAVTMTLLLAFTLGGSIIGFNKATHKEEAATTPAETSTAEGNDLTPGAKPEGATGEAPAETAAAATAASAKPASAGDVAAGEKAFTAATCVGCHGAKAAGGVGPALPKVVNGWTDEQFASAVREGKAPEKTLQAMMPHFAAAQVSDADLVNIHAYLKSLN